MYVAESAYKGPDSVNALPHSLAAERSVLGGILLLQAPAYAQVAGLVEPADFYHPAHRAIYQAIVSLDGTGKPIDCVTVYEQMIAEDTAIALRAFNGESYFAELMAAVVTVENIAYHARMVSGKATVRRLIETAQGIAAQGYGHYGDVETFLGETERAIFALTQRAQRGSYERARGILGRTLKAVEARYDRKQSITGVPSGFAALDALTCGFQPGELIVIAARPSMGKTALVMNAVQNAAIEHGIPALVFSIEMSKEALLERLLCSEAGIDSTALRTGMLRTIDWVNLTKAASSISEAPIWIDDSGAPTLSEIRSKARRWRSDPAAFPPGSTGLGLIAVDYMQLVQAGNGKANNREREIAEISGGLKQLAKELRLPVVALAQLNRGVESRADKRPQLGDLRESGSIEQDSDLIAFIYRDDHYNPDSKDPGIAEIIIGKQRNGPTGTARLGFEKSFTRFYTLRESAN